MEIIMVILAAIVAALLVGPAVAIGAIVDSRKVRSLAVLLRGRLEATSEELGSALMRAGQAETAAAVWERRHKTSAAALRCAEAERNELLNEREEFLAQIEHLYAILSKDGVEIEALRNEVTSLRKQRRFLVGQRDALVASVRGLTADTEGASADASATRALYSALMAERGSTFQRLSAADRRVKALEAFIEQAYGPLDECEISDSNGVW